MNFAFKRIAIVNRGEPAMRLIHAVRELNAESQAGLQTIALFTEPDRGSMYVREADIAHCIGPAFFHDAETNAAKSSYLDYGRLKEGLIATRAEAVWVGWGFVAEHAAFADLCASMGIIFVGPSGEVMRRLGDKIASKLIAEAANVPVSPWSGGPVETVKEAVVHAERIGYPLVIKATAGGGGRGIRRVNRREELEEAFDRARSEALKAFGDGTVFLEKMVLGAKHVEVQVIADRYGNTWAAGVRDCTVQRRNQKVIEEAPSPSLDADLERELREAAVRLAKSAGYVNAGTVECLFKPEEREFYFMEVNTRLQVEHPVTEATTGLDLVKLQLMIANGHRLEGEPPPTVGCAIEVRLNAEDPENGFAPSPGKVRLFRYPTGPGIRLDTGIGEGDTIPSEFDSMVAKVIARGKNRREAIARLNRALRESKVVIEGGTSNKPFLLELLEHSDFQNSAIDVSWLDRTWAEPTARKKPFADVALIRTAIQVYDTHFAFELNQFLVSSVRGRPKVRDEIGLPVELKYQGQSYNLSVYRRSETSYRVLIDNQRVHVTIDRKGHYESWLCYGGDRYHVISQMRGLDYLVEVNGVPHRVCRDDGGIVRSSAPAIVLSVAVKEGDLIAQGERIAVLEAMKMEMPVLCPSAGRVKQVFVTANLQVAAGSPLIALEPIETEEGAKASSQSSPRLTFQSDSNQNAEGVSRDRNRDDYDEILLQRCLANLTELKPFLLGYDVAPVEIRSALRELSFLREERLAANPRVLALEEELLQCFVDLIALSAKRVVATDLMSFTSAEYLNVYLRNIDGAGKGLPTAFVDRLTKALKYYEVSSLDRGHALEEALVWIYKSTRRADQLVTPMVRILERRLDLAEMLTPKIGSSFHRILDAIVDATHGRFLEMNDLARQLRFRYFEQPALAEAQRQLYEDLTAHIVTLEKTPSEGALTTVMNALVECPQPLVGFLSRWFNGATEVRRTLLESLLRRFYNTRRLEAMRSFDYEGLSLVSTEFSFDTKRTHVITVMMEWKDFPFSLSLVRKYVEDHIAAFKGDVLLDMFISSVTVRSAASDAECLMVARVLNEAKLPSSINRVCVVLANPDHLQTVHYYTLGRTEQGYEEVPHYRGIHPMWAGRLELWRLRNFNIERIPCVEDVFLFHCVAKDNAKDERVFAFADIRELVPIKNEEGMVVQLPHMERRLLEALAGIRDFQYRRPQHQRLQWNRVYLHVWPPLLFSMEELNLIMQRLGPSTQNLGIEKLVVRAQVPDAKTGNLVDRTIHFSINQEAVVRMRISAPTDRPIRSLTPYAQNVVKLRRHGLVYPYELVRMITPEREGTQVLFPRGQFTEYDFNERREFVPIQRPYGSNQANVVVGVIRNFTQKYPEGMMRVIILGDPSRGMGSLAEAECSRIIASIELAVRLKVPVEWYPVSSGAKIAMDSGTENLDWTAQVLRSVIEFTQRGGEINIIVAGINVGAQSYWNAEATMLMHTKGILVMTPEAAMVLTGKRALDYSGSVSGENNVDIGGAERVMGLNGQSQYIARDITEACLILFQHYEYAYVAPGERFPRRCKTRDPYHRDISTYPHSDPSVFATVGDIFSVEKNAQRKKPFDIRSVMRAVSDQDHPHLERWSSMYNAEIAVVWDVYLGGIPVCLIGIESKPLTRFGFVPGDGPETWAGGTLYPQSSRKIARAINSASGNRPIVFLANLSGFDGSPESMRKFQLEYGAEIGRAVVNFDGPLIFCVVSRYHGGAYVVFSKTLNKQLEVAAIEGSYASVIGGAPAAAVVLTGEVRARAYRDPRIKELQQKRDAAIGAEKAHLTAQLNAMLDIVMVEKQGEVSEEFDRVHSIERAKRVGSLDYKISPTEVRPFLIQILEKKTQIN